MAKQNMLEAINGTLQQVMQEDPTTVVLGQDVAVNGGVFRATDHLLEKYGKDRVLDTPLAEAGIVGAALGMAINGLKPIAEIQFSGFMFQAFHQLVEQVARMRKRTCGSLTVPLVIRAPYGGGIRAPEHHSESYEALYAHIPGLKVVIPATPKDAKGLLMAAVKDPDPVLFFEPKRMYRAYREEVPEESYEVPIGKANVVKEGKDVTLITFGAMLRPAIEAAELAAQKDIDAEVIDLRTISPLDRETILASVKKTGRVVIVHEAHKSGGIGAEIAAEIANKALEDLQAPVERVTGYDVTFPYFKLEELYLPNAEKIMIKIEEVMQF